MSMPVIEPSETTQCQAFNDLLESIALQETGLAHLINAEGEKIQHVLAMAKSKEGKVTVNDLISVNKSVSETLTKIIKMEMLLEFKLEEVNKIKFPDCDYHFPPHKPPCEPR